MPVKDLKAIGLFFKNDNAHRILLLLVYLCVLLLGVMIITVPPGIDPDSGWGFMVMRGMERGNHFNLLVSPNPANISTNTSVFLSWWSPGQYLLPYLFKSGLNINTGQATSLTVITCHLTGLTGFYMLFKQLGFTKWISALSIAFIATQQFFLVQFVYFTGGEVLLFAFMGWFLYGCFRFEKLTWRVLLFIFFAAIIGFFSKSSVLWILAAGVCCTWINISAKESFSIRHKISAIEFLKNRKRIWVWLKNGIILSIPLFAALLIIFVFYLSKGPNPGTFNGQFVFKPEALGFPLASTMISAFSIDELSHGLIDQQDGIIVPYQWAICIIGILALLSLTFILQIKKFSPGKKYAVAFTTCYVFGCIVFSYLFLKQFTVSYEGRHFRIIGLLAIPGIINLLFKTKTSAMIFFIFWTVFAGIGFSYFNDELDANSHASGSASGLSQQLYDKATINEITKIDHKHHNDAIFVVMSSDIGAEIYNNRVITIEADSMTERDLSELKYAGYGGPVYILMPAGYLRNGKNLMIIKSFTAYHNFSVKQLSGNYYLYAAIN